MSGTPARAEPTRSAMLIIQRPDGQTGYPITADQFAEHSIEVLAAALEQAVVRRGQGATSVTLLIDWPDRTTKVRWSPEQATAGHFALALAVPMRPDRVGITGNLSMRRWTLPWGWPLMSAKEIGPPRWWWPRLGIKVDRHRLWLLAGWNFTAYHLSLHWSWPADAQKRASGTKGEGHAP